MESRMDSSMLKSRILFGCSSSIMAKLCCPNAGKIRPSRQKYKISIGFLLFPLGKDELQTSFHCRQKSKCAISKASFEARTLLVDSESSFKGSNVNSDGHLGSSRAFLLYIGLAKLLITGGKSDLFKDLLPALLLQFVSVSAKFSKDFLSSASISLARLELQRLKLN